MEPVNNPKIAIFLVFSHLYIYPAIKTNTAPTIKFANSPTSPVCVPLNITCNMFLNNSIPIPSNGPSAKEPSSAGRSLMSIFKKLGNIGIDTSKNININAITDKSDILIILFKLLCLIINPLVLLSSRVWVELYSKNPDDIKNHQGKKSY